MHTTVPRRGAAPISQSTLNPPGSKSDVVVQGSREGVDRHGGGHPGLLLESPDDPIGQGGDEGVDTLDPGGRRSSDVHLVADDHHHPDVWIIIGGHDALDALDAQGIALGIQEPAKPGPGIRIEPDPHPGCSRPPRVDPGVPNDVR